MSFMNTNRPPRSDWRASYAALKDFVTTNGSLPSKAGHAVLYGWVSSQRTRFRRGTLGAEQERLLRDVPGVLEFKSPLIDSLAEFVAAHGRLPSSAAADPQEYALGRYLVYSLRPTARTGTISDATFAKATAIPGALTADRRPDQHSILEELRSYVAEHGYMPPTGGAGSRDEYRLACWVRNNIKGDREQKAPALRERHDALIELAATVPSKAQHLAGLRIRELEQACTENGWRPAGVDAWLKTQYENSADELLRARITRILEHPPLREYGWRRDLKLLIDFEAATGRLPRGWHDGHVYSWLATQRKDHRSGALAAWKTKLLQEVYGALPAVRRRAA